MPDVTPAQREAIDVVFQAFHRYLGVAVGEHLGYLFTGYLERPDRCRDSSKPPTHPGGSELAGIVVGALLMICSLEFVGPFEQEGWSLAAAVTPIAYIAWSAWLMVMGVTLLL